MNFSFTEHFEDYFSLITRCPYNYYRKQCKILSEKCYFSYEDISMFFLKSGFLLGEHKYHNMGQAVGLTEPLDDRIVKYLKN